MQRHLAEPELTHVDIESAFQSKLTPRATRSAPAVSSLNCSSSRLQQFRVSWKLCEFEQSASLQRSHVTSMDSTKMEVANRNPTFGSSLLNDNFGQRQAEDDLDPLQLQPSTEGSREQNSTKNDRSSTKESGQSTSGQQDSLDSLMAQNPNGATQRFTDMHGIPAALEERDPLDKPGGRQGMRQMVNETAGGRREGVTDWGTGTDGGQSDKPQVGIAYGSFSGV